jgi:hypothetical protein
MTNSEINMLLKAIKSGKVYFKPLPYSEVKGGTWIRYDKEQKKFVERYINISLWDRGSEDYTKLYTTKELREMFRTKKYKDTNYMFPTKQDTYELQEPEIDSFKKFSFDIND